MKRKAYTLLRGTAVDSGGYRRTLYFARIRDGGRYRYFGPGGAPDMPAYDAHQFYYPQGIQLFERGEVVLMRDASRADRMACARLIAERLPE